MSDVIRTSPARGRGKAYHIIFWWCDIFGIRGTRQNMLWSRTHATCRNVFKQFNSCNNLIDVKMTSPAIEGGSVYYIFSSVPTKFHIGEFKLISKLWKLKKIGAYKFKTIGIIWYFISMWRHFDITGRSSVNTLSAENQ